MCIPYTRNAGPHLNLVNQKSSPTTQTGTTVGWVELWLGFKKEGGKRESDWTINLRTYFLRLIDVKIFPILMYKIPWNLGFIHVLFSTHAYPHFPFGMASPFFQVQVQGYLLPFLHLQHFIISKDLNLSLLIVEKIHLLESSTLKYVLQKSLNKKIICVRWISVRHI